MKKVIRKAFTLIELLVVIAIIGILSGLIVVSMSGVTAKANFAKAQAFSNSLRNALMTNVVGEWKFDELTTAVNGATIKNSWTENNNGTLVTGDALEKLSTDCISNKCLSFDGTNDYIDFGSVNITDALTVSFWMKQTRDAQTLQYIINNDRDMSPPVGGFDVRTNNYILNGAIWKNSNSALERIVGVAVPEGAWHFAAFTFDGTKLALFQNGIQTKSLTITADKIYAAPRNLIVGSMAYSAPTYFRYNGLLDEIRIYDMAMNLSQIKEQYYVGLNSLLANGGITKEDYLSRVNEYAFK